MMDKRKALLFALAPLALGGFLAACERQEGPAEEVGEAIDQGAHDTGKAMEEAGERMQEQPGT